MKIIFIYSGSFPNGLAMTNRLKLYAKGLQEIGNNVQILIPHATDKYLKNIDIKGEHNGIKYKYFSKKTVRSKSFAFRRFNDFFGYFKLLIYLINLKTKIDIVLLVDVRNFWRIPIYILCKIRKTKVVYELNEHPLVFSTKFKYFFEKHFIFKMFDGFIVISENLKFLLNNFKKKDCLILKVPIINEIKKNNLDSIVINSIMQKKFILHSGGLIESKEGISTILKSIHLVNNNSDFELNIYFTGHLSNSIDKDFISNTIIKLGLSNHVKFLGYLNDIELYNYQFNSILFLLIKPNNLQNNYCFPTKLGEYMTIGKPIIATNVGEYMNYLTNDFNSLIVANDDPVLIANNIIKVLRDNKLYNNLGINAKYTSNFYFNYKIHARNINSFFFEILNYNA
jgi:glycosyltransferase involved in cell wall biosynthesis